MSSYLLLFCSLICFAAGVMWSSDSMLVMGVVFVCTSVIVSRLDAIIVMLRGRQ